MIEWTRNYIQAKDAVLQNILKIQTENNGLAVTFKNRKEFLYVQPILPDEDKIRALLDKNPYLTIVVINSQENLGTLIENWKRLIDYQQLSIIFINPFSSLDNKWSINPYIHNKICDNASLKTGLKSMFETVEEITEESFSSLMSDTRK